VKYSEVVLVISMMFTPELIKMGVEIFVSSAKQFESTRFMGFYKAGGDFNSTGVFLVGMFGFFLALFEKTGGIKNYVFYMGMIVLGILLTGSRTSFLALLSVLSIFVIFNKSGSAKFYIIAAFVIFYFTFSKQLELIVLRFLDPSAVGAVDPESDGRVFKWIFYTNWIINNPETLIYGNQELIDIPGNRAPHNYFLYIVYHTGIVPLLIFISLFIKLVKTIKLNVGPYELRNIYYLLPFPFVLMTVNSFGSAIYLWIFLPIGASIIMKKSLKGKKI